MTLDQTLKSIKKANDIAKAEASGLKKIFDEAGTDIGTAFKDVFKDIFKTGDVNFKKLGKSIVKTMKDSARKVADELVLNPVVDSLTSFAKSAATNLFGGFVNLLGGGSALGSAGGIGTASASGSSATGAGSGILGGANAFNLGADVSSVLRGGLLSAAGKDAVFSGIANGLEFFGAGSGFANTTANFLTDGLSFSPFGVIGSLGANALGLGGGIGGTLGGIGGSIAGGALGSTFAALGSFGGPVGAIAGSFLGTALGGLFGGGKPKIKKAVQPIVFDAAGRATLGDATVRRGGDLGRSEAGGLAVTEALNKVLDIIGASIAGLPGRVAFFSKNKGGQREQIISEFSPGVGVNKIFDATPQGIKAAVEDITFQTLKAAAKFANGGTITTTTPGVPGRFVGAVGATPGSPGALVPSIPVNTLAGAAIQAGLITANGTPTRGQFVGAVAATAGTPGTLVPGTAAVTTTTTVPPSGLQGASDNVLSAILKSKATDLSGLTSDIDFALFIDGLVGTVDAVTKAQQAISAINKTFDQSTKRAEALGISLESLDAARAREILKLTTDFDTGVTQSILAFTDPLQLALDRLAKNQAARLREAEALGADLVAVERLNGLERQKVLEQFAGNVMGLVERLRNTAKSLEISDLSPLSPRAQLAQTRGQFAAAFTRGLGGDLASAREAESLARPLLDASRAVNASSPGFVQDFNAVQASLNRLADSFGAENIATNRQGFSGVISTLQTEIGSLRAEVVELRREIERQGASARVA